MMRGVCLTVAWYAMSVFSIGFANEFVSSVPIPPIAAGEIIPEVGNRCLEFSGRYALLGKLISGSVSSPIDLELENILGAPYVQASYNPANKLYADVFFGSEAHKLEAEFFVGAHSVKWSTREFTCEQGWLKLSYYSEGGAEGNRTKAHTTSYLRRNTKGDLVVFHTVKGRTSNLFGLVRSNIDDQAWLVFPALGIK